MLTIFFSLDNWVGINFWPLKPGLTVIIRIKSILSKINNTNKNDAGTYRVLAENPLGSDENDSVIKIADLLPVNLETSSSFHRSYSQVKFRWIFLVNIADR